MPTTPARNAGPQAWRDHREQGARTALAYVKELLVAVDGIVARVDPWRPNRSKWLIIGRTVEQGSFIPQNTRVTAHVDTITRKGCVWFTWSV
jgi:hypothetical protein